MVHTHGVNNSTNNSIESSNCSGIKNSSEISTSESYPRAKDPAQASVCSKILHEGYLMGSSSQCCQDFGIERCDESCIESLAAYECQRACEDFQNQENSLDAHGGCQTDYNHMHEHDEEGNHSNDACTSHLRLAFEKYSSYLKTARCICRSVLGKRLVPCCARQSSIQKLATTATTTIQCLSKPCGSISQFKEREITKPVKAYPYYDQSAHYDGHDQNSIISTFGAEKSPRPGHCYSGCCSNSRQSNNARTTPSLDERKPIIHGDIVDIENSIVHEHVVLSVSGMTCSGCGNKLSKVLQETSGVFNVQVNFVMGNANFDINPLSITVEALICRVNRMTGFHCNRMANIDQYIDLLMSRDSIKLVTDNFPLGVSQVDILDTKTARLTYNPRVVGARSLIAFLGELTSGLAPVNHQDPSAAAGRRILFAVLSKTVLAAIFTIPVVVFAWGHNLVDERIKAYVSIILATMVQILAIPEFYKPAISSLIYSHVVEMDMLVVISITAAYSYSVVAFGFMIAGKPLQTEEFFETGTLLITLVLFGRLVAAYARVRAIEAVSTRSLQPVKATLVEEDGVREIDVRLLQLGDTFMVMPHTKVPTDGLIIDGNSEVDESMLTGEGLPVLKCKGTPVIAGTINGSGVLKVHLTRLPGKNTVAEIANLVEQASNYKPRIQNLADRVAGWFVPVVSLIASVVFVLWVIVSLKSRGEGYGTAIGRAVTYTIAVLAVSCPCALGLAVSMVLVIAGGVAARGGVIIKSAESIERTHRVSDVVLDKTGTITTSQLDVVVANILASEHDETLSLTKALVRDNKHPVSVAVSKYLELQSFDQRIENIRLVPGAGVQANIGQSLVRAGNAHWLEVEHLPQVSGILGHGMTTLCVVADSVLLAVFGLKSNLRPEAISVIRELRKRKVNVHLVSGDEQKAVEDVALSVDIPKSNVAARKGPAEKQTYVHCLMEQGKTVLFCGDGTNDAVAIAQADVGVQIGPSSDVSRATADVVLLSGLEGLLLLRDVSRASFNRVVVNFAWSAIYNIFAILLAAGAFVRVRIPPAYAGLGELVSVLPVILVAMSTAGMRKPSIDNT